MIPPGIFKGPTKKKTKKKTPQDNVVMKQNKRSVYTGIKCMGKFKMFVDAVSELCL